MSVSGGGVDCHAMTGGRAGLAVSIPPARELAASCAALIRGWHDRPVALDWEAVTAAFPAAEAGWTTAVVDLCLINCFQWHLEDECRACYADHVQLAALKRGIDESNRRRVAAIDAIDERLVRELDGRRAATTGPVALTTPGNLLDRISILELKRYHAAGSEIGRILEEQANDACDGLDGLIDDLVHGRRRVKLYRTVKLYGSG
jgi:hypothetical protein